MPLEDICGRVMLNGLGAVCRRPVGMTFRRRDDGIRAPWTYRVCLFHGEQLLLKDPARYERIRYLDPTLIPDPYWPSRQGHKSYEGY